MIERDNMLEIGVSTNNECGKDDYEILNNIANAGFKNVMLSFKSKNIEENIKTIKDLGLNISYFHTDSRYADDLWSLGESSKEYVENIKKQIEVCGKYNIPIAVMHATKGNPGNIPLKPNKEALKKFKEIVEVAKKYNVKIALENVDLYSIKHLYYLLDNVKDECVGFCYDVGHHHLYAPKINLLKKYGNRLLALHLHDNFMDWYKGYDYTRDMHLLPFDGKIDFEKVCAKLKELNYKGVIMLELHKKSFGEPKLYDNTSNEEYLKEAYKRAERLVEMTE